MTKDKLIKRLRSELSWALAHKAENPAFQAYLELEREKNDCHVNDLGTHWNDNGEDISDLFKPLEEYEKEQDSN